MKFILIKRFTKKWRNSINREVKAIDDQNREIIADKITYKKLPNIVEAEGKVKVDKLMIEIYSDKAIYKRNENGISKEIQEQLMIKIEKSLLIKLLIKKSKHSWNPEGKLKLRIELMVWNLFW